MDMFGLICFFWGIAFTVACKNYGFLTWNEMFFPWRLYRNWSDFNTNWREQARWAWKGIAIAPVSMGIIMPLHQSDYSFDEILNTWVRLFLTGLGIVLGLFLARFLRERRN